MPDKHPPDVISKADSRVQMTQVAVAMLAGKTIVEIAAELGFPKSRIERWRRDPVFKDVYAEVEAKLSDEVITDAATYLREQVDRLLPQAMKALADGLAEGNKMADRLNAAGKVAALAKPRVAEAKVIPIEAMIREKARDASGPASGD